jgi:hypothetical protein
MPHRKPLPDDRDEEDDLDVGTVDISEDAGSAQDREEEIGPANDEPVAIDEPVGEGAEAANASDLDIGDIELKEDPAPVGDADLHDGLAAVEDAPHFEDHDGRSLADAGGRDDEPPAVGELIEDEPPGSADDGGAEGMTGVAEDEIDEHALPELDADDEGEVEVDDLLRQLGFSSDGEAWEAVGSLAVDRPLAAIACDEGRVAAVGAALAVLGPGDPAPRARRLAEVAHACVWDDDRVAFATARGVHCAKGTAKDTLVYASAGVSALAVAAGRLWALAGTSLVGIDAAAGTHAVARDDVLAIAAAAGTLYVVAGGSSTARARLLRLRGQDGDWEEVSESAALAAHVRRGARLAVNGASAMAVLDGGQVFVRRPGRSLAPTHVDRAVAVAFRGDAPDAPLLVVLEDGQLGFVAPSGDLVELGAGRIDGGVRGLAWDTSRDLAFVVGPGGLAAVGPRIKH